MEKHSSPDFFYSTALSEAAHSLQRIKSHIYRISTIRLLLFVAGVAAFIYFWGEGWIWLTGIVGVTFVPFLLLVKSHNSLFYKREYEETKIAVNEQELNALNGDCSAFDGGAEFINSQHLFSYDLDLFGEKSLFQRINRTTTLFGKEKLADWLQVPLRKKAEILHRQEELRELSQDPSFLQEFRIAGLIAGSDPSDLTNLREWIQQPVLFHSRSFLRKGPYLAGMINLLAWGLAIAGVIPYSVPGLVFVVFVIISFGFTPRITKAQAAFEKRWKILSTYARMLALIETREMKSTGLRALKNELRSERATASETLHRLSHLLNALDQRNNVLMAALLNGLFFWELWQMMRVERWKLQHAPCLLPWLEGVGEMEALTSMATFAYNHDDCIFPSVADHPFVFEATSMGHPLMDRARCVKNDLSITRRPYFLIVTGANMAGKSTYLRTVGINYVLACTGMPVCAEEMHFYPALLITGLRTNDSLSENESYFFAELKRLSLILEYLKEGREVFVILDEILRGTNSTDKQKGSMALVRQFVQLGANGLLATHDLQLASLRDAFPGAVGNFCFEAEIRDGELTFTYRMHEGVAQNMNACFLMKKMGFDI